MTQKDKLLNDIGMPDAEETLKPILDGYAIGRWVPVSERLPELDGKGRFSGIIYTSDDRTAAGLFDWEICKGIITHWLDLDMPSGKGGEG